MTVVIREIEEGGRSRAYTEITVVGDGREDILVANVIHHYFEGPIQHRAAVRAKKAIARLIDSVGIDNQWDADHFQHWWHNERVYVETAYARYKGSAGVPATFAEFCSQAFLDWLEPMDDNDKQAQQEYNVEDRQHWLIIGLENSAVVDLDYTLDGYVATVGYPHRITYTSGDYPTFKTFEYIAWVNKEIEKWTNFLHR